jgi:hypothetical protein
MHAAVTRVRIDPNRLDEARRILHEKVIPYTREREGFDSAYFLGSPDGTHGLAVELYETEAQARSAATPSEAAPPEEAPVELEDTEVYEVIGKASSRSSLTHQFRKAFAGH